MLTSLLMKRFCLVLGFCAGLVSDGLSMRLNKTEALKNSLDFLNKKGMAFFRAGCGGLIVGPAAYEFLKRRDVAKRSEGVFTTLTKVFNRAKFEEDVANIKMEMSFNLAMAEGLGAVGLLMGIASFLSSNEEGLKGWAKFGTGSVLGGALSVFASIKFADKVKAVLPHSVVGFYNPLSLTAAGVLIGGLLPFVKNPFAKEKEEGKK